MSIRVLSGLVFSSLIAPLSAFAQADPKADSKGSSVAAPGATDVKQAIQRGLEYLRSRQNDKGHWVFERDTPVKDQPTAPPKFQEDPAFNLGLTALVALAMVENGVLPSDPAIQKAYTYIKEEAITNKRTYNLGLTILFLSRLGSREDRPLIHRLARRLTLGQFDSGGWPYDCPIDAERESSRVGLQGHTRKAGVGDNSNTQFAVMGLWAASRAGVQVDEALELIAKRFRETQAPTGGWDYQSTGKADSNAMTSAGVYALTVAAAAASRKASAHASAAEATPGKSAKSTEKGARSTTGSSSSSTATVLAAADKSALADDEVFKKGIKRVEQFAAEIGPGVSPYFLWSIERLGVTLQMTRFGEVDWYAKGMKALLDSQKKDGSWELAWKGPADTAFSLLFLRKAHLGRDISYALTGDASKPFLLLGKEKPQPFAKLTEAVAAAADNDVIEIMGHGPFELAGVICNGKSLTIRGGEGFEPVLVHKIELLQNPDRDAGLRYMLGVVGARLSLEGLRIQMDPDQSSKTGWTQISVDGGELRAANCSFTQSNSTAVTGFELIGAAKLTLQNCMFAGFSRTIDALVSGEQQVDLENCLVHSRMGIQAKSPAAQDTAGLTVHWARNTFHVGEVVNLGGLSGPAQFTTEANIFHTATFSTQLRPSASSPVVRKWDGRRNVFDLTRWLSVAGQGVREVKDLDSWRKYWKTKEEGSFTRSVPFAVNHQLGPFRHNANPNDWRLSVERLTPDHSSDVQIGCDVYLVGAGQPYFQFRESIAYDAWRGAESGARSDAAGANGIALTDDAKLIEGTWMPVEAELGGQKLPEDTLKVLKLILKGDHYTVLVGNQTDEGTIKLDPAKTPKAMDITGTEGPNKGKTILTIYELSGDTLKVCYALQGGTRPDAFESKPGSTLFLVTYKREKP